MLFDITAVNTIVKNSPDSTERAQRSYIMKAYREKIASSGILNTGWRACAKDVDIVKRAAARLAAFYRSERKTFTARDYAVRMNIELNDVIDYIQHNPHRA